MLLSEMYTPQQVDLRLLALLVIGNGSIEFNAIKGDNNLIDSAERLMIKGLLQVRNGTYRLTVAGKAVSKNNGLYNSTENAPSTVAHQFAHSQSGATQTQDVQRSQ